MPSASSPSSLQPPGSPTPDEPRGAHTRPQLFVCREPREALERHLKCAAPPGIHTSLSGRKETNDAAAAVRPEAILLKRNDHRWQRAGEGALVLRHALPCAAGRSSGNSQHDARCHQRRARRPEADTPAPQPALPSAATHRPCAPPRRPRAAAPRAPQRPPPRARPGGPPNRAALTERQQQRLQGAGGQRGARPAEHGWGGAGRSFLRSVRAGGGTGGAGCAHRSHLLAPVKPFSPFTAPSSPPVLSSRGVPPVPLSEQLYPWLSPCLLLASCPCRAPRTERGYKAAPAPPNSGRTPSGCAGAAAERRRAVPVRAVQVRRDSAATCRGAAGGRGAWPGAAPCLALPHPPGPDGFAGKFDASPGFFIGTGKKKKKEEGETSPAQAEGLHSLSPSPCHFTELLDFLLLLLEKGQRGERSCSRCLPASPVPARPELREHQVAAPRIPPARRAPPKAESARAVTPHSRSRPPRGSARLGTAWGARGDAARAAAPYRSTPLPRAVRHVAFSLRCALSSPVLLFCCHCRSALPFGTR